MQSPYLGPQGMRLAVSIPLITSGETESSESKRLLQQEWEKASGRILSGDLDHPSLKRMRTAKEQGDIMSLGCLDLSGRSGLRGS